MPEEGYRRVLSILRGEGYSDEYPTISKFKKCLNEPNLLEEELNGKWVLCERQPAVEGNTKQVQDRIVALLKYLIHTQNILFHCLVQFWAAVEVEEHQYCLSTKHQPFCVSYLNKGTCKYRNRCIDYVYNGAATEEDDEHHGGVRRAYLKKHPESTPDLRLYSIKEFTLRDYAARCGFTSYLALPLFDLLTNRCYGVLELLSCFSLMELPLLSSMDQGLQIQPKYQHGEITEILELAIKAIPGSYLALVWVPCKQCPNKSTNLCCMERAAFINSRSKIVSLCDDETDADMFAYLQACEFHNLQIDLGCTHPNSCDLRISQNPLAHYAAMARLSFCHTIYLKSVHDNIDSCVVELFLPPNCRQDACGDSSLLLLLRIMEVKLENFEFARKEQLPKQLMQPNAIECESIDMLKVMDFREEKISEQGLTEQLGVVELCGLSLSSEGKDNGWVFCRPAREDSESLPADIAVKEKIKLFLKKIAVKFRTNSYSMVQYWAPTKVEGKCYLETSHQPYALGFLAKGLASFRKECMKHKYCVENNAKEEELGPPGRVFKNGLPETSLDVSCYSNTDFFLRKYALHCGFKEYFVLPVFDDDDKNKCFGVLELIGFSYSELYSIKSELEAVKLSSALVDFFPRFLANKEGENISLCRTEALVEVRDAFNLIRLIPQLYSANVWVPYEECVGINSHIRCMELALCSESTSEFMPMDRVRWVYVQPKKGTIGTVLASESQACFCRNLRGFNIADQPLSHYEMRDRRDVCFAICLQSSHSGDLVYVLEFFLNQGPATYEYLNSFLNFLLPIMKQKLKTFKMASGKQLGTEFEVEVVEFSESNKLTSSEPVKFRSVPYGQKEDQYSEEQQVESVSYAKQQAQGEALNLSLPQNDAVKDNSAATCSFQKTKGGKRRTNSKIDFEIVKKHSGKKLQDVVRETTFSRSKIKRLCRDNGIPRWPPTPSHVESSLLSERECAWDPQQDFQPSSSSNHLQPEESSKHVIVQEGEEKVTVKVTYKDTIRFELCLSSGVGKLFEEVATTLNLKRGNFKLKYIDEDKDEILLTSDADLQFCPKSRTATGKTCIKFFVQLISE